MTAGAHLRFRSGLFTVRQAQEERLLATVRKNRHTVFGREHGFAGIRNVDDYRRRVPIRPPEAFAQHIDRIRQGERNVLTAEDVLLLQPTSGTHGTKLIPYTASLREEFRHALSPWLHEIALGAHGTQYWSISPPTPRDIESAVPVGFDSDGAYLRPEEAREISGLLRVPPAVAQLPMDAFRYSTQLHLLADGNLGFASVWSPTFLPAVFGDALDHAEALVRDIHDGTNQAARRLRPRADPGRAAAVARILADGSLDAWPGLTVSCWTEGSATHAVPALTRMLPSAHITGKGLVATEGIISIPVAGENVFAGSHFTEFVGDDGVYLAHELRPGERYRVVLTNGGGLYRYDLGDVVQVTGIHGQAPALRFVGRNRVVDLVGEKLSETLVQDAFDAYRAVHGDRATFLLLAPNDVRDGYRLFIAGHDQEELPSVRDRIEERLCTSFHYAHAHALGQLRPLEADAVGADAPVRYLEAKRNGRRQLGSVKPSSLEASPGWDRILEAAP